MREHARLRLRLAVRPAHLGLAAVAQEADRVRRTRVLGRPTVTIAVASLRRRGDAPPDLLRAMLDGPVDPVAMALPALVAAGESDPLQAALEALWAAVSTYASRRGEFLAAVRRAFPIVDQTDAR